tara:strand:- start:166 stop:579 length:414 start_codon:yes stop_codon:yes gene_type:complete
MLWSSSYYIFSNINNEDDIISFDFNKAWRFIDDTHAKEDGKGFLFDPYFIQDNKDLFFMGKTEDEIKDFLLQDNEGSVIISSKHPNINDIIKTSKDLGGTCYDTNLKEISDQLFFDKIERNFNKDFKFMIVEVDTEE